jgi:hypothetical protein
MVCILTTNLLQATMAAAERFKAPESAAAGADTAATGTVSLFIYLLRILLCPLQKKIEPPFFHGCLKRQLIIYLTWIEISSSMDAVKGD